MISRIRHGIFVADLFVTENHAIVAWFKRGFADERKQTRDERRI